MTADAVTLASPPAASRERQILAAARDVFAEHGFAAAPVEEIARRAGIAKGTVYLYFPSKEALCEAALLAGIDELMAAIAAAVDRERGARDRLHAFLRTKLETFAGNRSFLRMYLREFGPVHQRPGRPGDAVEAARRRQLAILERVLREGVRAGELRALPIAATARWIGQVSRALVEELVHGERHPSPRRAAEEAIDLLFRGIQS
jgi:AcrR family transcriptional regulator